MVWKRKNALPEGAARKKCPTLIFYHTISTAFVFSIGASVVFEMSLSRFLRQSESTFFGNLVEDDWFGTEIFSSWRISCFRKSAEE